LEGKVGKGQLAIGKIDIRLWTQDIRKEMMNVKL